MCTVVTAGSVYSTKIEARVASAEEVFEKKEVERIKKEVDKQPVYVDKDQSNGKELVQLKAGVNANLKAKAMPAKYPTRKGVILVTSDAFKGLIPTGHAAIVYSKKKVIESLHDGVQKGNNNWYSKHKTCYGVTTHGTTSAMDAYVADWCNLQVGKDYNYNYFNVSTRKKFYCSQLVWAGYLDKELIDLNTNWFGGAVHPMELVWTSKTYTVYEQK